MALVPAAPAGPAPREADMFGKAQTSGAAADYEAYLSAFPQGLYAELARVELAAIAEKLRAPAAPVAPAATIPAPTGTPVAPAPQTAVLSAKLTFKTPLPIGGPVVEGRSIEDLAQGSPLFPPIEGIPDSMWKGQQCSACHSWTRDALCDQGKTYLGRNAERALVKQHPYGGAFKQSLRYWAEGGCQ